jgi:hypothetical protein
VGQRDAAELGTASRSAWRSIPASRAASAREKPSSALASANSRMAARRSGSCRARAQWNELVEDPEQKIGRPRQLFVGAPERRYAPIAERG